MATAQAAPLQQVTPGIKTIRLWGLRSTWDDWSTPSHHPLHQKADPIAGLGWK